MGGFISFLLIYLLGGISFLPLLVIAILVHGYFVFPIRDDTIYPRDADTLLRPGDTDETIKSTSNGAEDKFEDHGPKESDVAAGYFAVCREYVPGGVNGKPPERTTPAGSTVITSPSPSVYQSMYRSMFDRKKNASPIDHKGVGKPQKKGGNIFFVVLRHSHLMLFDDDEQLEVRYVISLAHHTVSIYGGGEQIPDGELFIKRNALCLSRKDTGQITADASTSKPFFLFTDNTSEKEDFYFALLKNQEHQPDSPDNPPTPLLFEVKNIIDLVQRLHSSEEHMQTRWINAMIGRVFLGIYKTTDVENFIRAKITKKISRVKKPSFLSNIVLRNVYMGEGPPYITNPRLKDLTVEGDCVVEGDLHYSGNFRLEIAATAKIDLGTRFKAREVNLVLAVVVKKVEGHVLLRVKPPPSNRFWYSFATTPKIELRIEPIVSSRQITYTIILRHIENRIKEVIAESVVMPFWDDVAFYSTLGKKWRGGIWAENATSSPPSDLESMVAEEGEVDELEELEAETSTINMPPMEKSMSVPVLETAAPPSSTFARKATRSVFNMGTSKNSGSSTSVDTRSSTPDRPRAMRHGSFTSSSTPVVGTDSTTVDAIRSGPSTENGHAASHMAALSALSQSTSPAQTPVGSPTKTGALGKSESYSSTSSTEPATPVSNGTKEASLASITTDSELSLPGSNQSSRVNSSSHLPDAIKLSDEDRLHHRSPSSSSRNSGARESPGNQQKRTTLTAVASAAASAKRWGLNALQRNQEFGMQGLNERSGSLPRTDQPMGRGRPLPPPGVPLPLPDKKTRTAPIPVPKRKPLPPPALPRRPQENGMDKQPSHVLDHVRDDPAVIKRRKTPPALPKRQQNVSSINDDENVFVVAAPDSDPTTPSGETNYVHPWVEDEEEESLAASAKPPTPLLPRRSEPVTGSPEEDENQLPSWMAAQEIEARGKSMMVDDDAGQVLQ